MSLSSDKSIDEIRSELLSGASRLARRASWVYRLRAVCLWLAVLVALLCGLLASDILLRREEVGLRMLAQLLWWGVALGTAVRLLRPAWDFRPTAAAVARWIDQTRPDIGDQLSTAVELAQLGPADQRYGSTAFRDSALRQWASRQAPPQWDSFLETNRLWRACAALGSAFGCGLLLLICWPSETRLALTRLTLPWSASHWPQEDRLVLRDPPTVVPVGQEVQIEIIDENSPLPEEVQLFMRRVAADGKGTVIRLPVTILEDVALANLPVLEHAVEIRAAGGDDQTMAWHRIDVVEPPEVERYRFEVLPPAYTAQEAQELVGRQISVLAGSRVAFAGELSEPIEHVRLEQLPPATSSVGADSFNPATLSDALGPVQLTNNNQRLEFGSVSDDAILLEQSLAWRLVITTRDGLQIEQSDRWAIDVTPDAVPKVALRPAELAEITSNASLRLSGSAKDDLGLVDVSLRASVEGESESQALHKRLWSRESATDEEILDYEIAARWEFAGAKELPLGSRLAVWLEATDSLGQIGKSEPQVFEISHPDAVLYAIENRQNDILQAVREAVDSQRRNSQLAARAREMVEQSAQLEREQVDLLSGIADVQRTIHNRLAAENSSVAGDLAQLHDLLVQNGLEQSLLAAELQDLQAEVVEVANQEIRTALTNSANVHQQSSARLGTESIVDADRKLMQSLEENAHSQLDALRALESVLHRMARSESQQQLHRELAEVLAQQVIVRNETDQLQVARVSSGNAHQLRAQQAALTADQQSLARRVEDFVQRSNELLSDEALARQSRAEQIERANAVLHREQTMMKMRQAGEELRNDQFTASAESQRAILAGLRDALRELGAAQRGQGASLESRAEQMREAGRALEDLATDQAALAKSLRDAEASELSPLGQRQAELAERGDLQAEDARQRGDQPTATGLDEAQQQQLRASQAAEQNDVSAAAAAAHQAAQKLRETVQQLAAREQGLQQEISRQHASQLAAAVDSLVTQQRPIVDIFLDTAGREPTAELQRQVWEAQVRAASAQQEKVRLAVRDVLSQTEELPAFHWTLQETESSMSRAVAAAQRFRIDPDATEAADTALRMLQLAAESLRDSPPQPASDNQQSADEDTSADEQRTTVPALANLKLLRGLQLDINQQTVELQQSEPSPRRSQKLSKLAAQQQSLGIQLEQLLKLIEQADSQQSAP